MTINLKLFLMILLLVNLFLIFKRFKLKKISVKYVVFWIILIFLLILSVCFDSVFLQISKVFGFEKTSNMIFLLGFFFLFYLNFIFMTTISTLNDKIKYLIQETSLLKERVEMYEKRK